MRRISADSLARTAALIAVGAFAVHQLRYLAGYGGAAGSELSRQGHGYLSGALPILAAFLLSAVAAGLLRAFFVRGGGRSGAGVPPVSLARRAALFSIAIAAIYACQESLEGALSAGHPAGVAAVLAHGGWVALPLAPVLGVLGALLDRGLSTLEVAIAGSHGPRRVRRERTRSAAAPRSIRFVPLAAAPLAFGIARRPPPLQSRS
ncbi:MAG: hypothetical protein ACXWZM_01455 [Solirubrobacterales bacterium]